MPNWCGNKLIISGSESQITSLFKKIKEDGLLQTFRPMPDAETLKKWNEERPFTTTELQLALVFEKDPNKGMEGEEWYPWRLQYWGTKWEENNLYLELDGTCIEAVFDSAWAPPIAAYQHFLEQNQGFEIEAYYMEPGCMFAGVWINGRDEKICGEEFDAPPDKRCDLWYEIDQHMDLSDMYEMMHEDDEEDEE